MNKKIKTLIFKLFFVALEEIVGDIDDDEKNVVVFCDKKFTQQKEEL